jgi:hypothetical protein
MFDAKLSPQPEPPDIILSIILILISFILSLLGFQAA